MVLDIKDKANILEQTVSNNYKPLNSKAMKTENDHVKYVPQTINGNPEVIKVINGIAREIIAGDKEGITIDQEIEICNVLNFANKAF